MRMKFAIVTVLAGLLAATTAAAETMAVFGWARDRASGTVYVTETVTTTERTDRRAADQRLIRALQREGREPSDLSVRQVGVPLDVTLTPDEAESARLRFINQARGRGETVRVLSW